MRTENYTVTDEEIYTREELELFKTLEDNIDNGISIRISENDLYELKKKSLESAIPYQNLIQMLVHQFAANKIKLNV